MTESDMRNERSNQSRGRLGKLRKSPIGYDDCLYIRVADCVADSQRAENERKTGAAIVGFWASDT